MNVRCVFDAFTAPRRLGRRLDANGKRMPVINLRHHDNHAWFWGSFAVRKVQRTRDGAGARRRRRRRRDLDLRRPPGLAQAAFQERQHLGFAGDHVRHHEFVPRRLAAAEAAKARWRLCGDQLSYQRYDGQLRDVFVFGSEGRIFLNRSLANWQRGGCSVPYSKRLIRISASRFYPRPCGTRMRCCGSRTSSTRRSRSIASTRLRPCSLYSRMRSFTSCSI